jgi:hypothetical protein
MVGCAWLNCRVRLSAPKRLVLATNGAHSLKPLPGPFPALCLLGVFPSPGLRSQTITPPITNQSGTVNPTAPRDSKAVSLLQASIQSMGGSAAYRAIADVTATGNLGHDLFWGRPAHKCTRRFSP